MEKSKDIESGVKLYKKFIEGTRWINAEALRGNSIKEEERRFKVEVSDPLDEHWRNLSEEDRKVLDEVTDIVDVFSGNIKIIDMKAVFMNTNDSASNDTAPSPLCLRCGAPGERFCLGDIGTGYEWGMFCLDCEPYNEQ